MKISLSEFIKQYNEHTTTILYTSINNKTVLLHLIEGFNLKKGDESIWLNSKNIPTIEAKRKYNLFNVAYHQDYKKLFKDSSIFTFIKSDKKHLVYEIANNLSGHYYTNITQGGSKVLLLDTSLLTLENTVITTSENEFIEVKRNAIKVNIDNDYYFYIPSQNISGYHTHLKDNYKKGLLFNELINKYPKLYQYKIEFSRRITEVGYKRDYFSFAENSTIIDMFNLLSLDMIKLGLKELTHGV